MFLVGALAVLARLLEWTADLLSGPGQAALHCWGRLWATLLGLALGLVGVLFVPLLVAASGEFLAWRDQQRALRVGLAAWLGLLAAMLAKVVLALTMVGVFIAALVW